MIKKLSSVLNASSNASKFVKVWALMGQSNSHPRADVVGIDPKYLGKQSNVYTISHGRYPLIENMELDVTNGGDTQGGNNGGVELTLFKDLADEQGYDHYVIHISQGATGSGIGEPWSPIDGYLWDSFRDAWTVLKQHFTDNNMTYQVDGCEWFQGENDIGEREQYYDRCNIMFGIIRDTLEVQNLPIFDGEINRAINSFWAAMADVQGQVCTDDPNAYLMSNTNKTWHDEDVHLDYPSHEMLSNEIKILFNSL